MCGVRLACLEDLTAIILLYEEYLREEPCSKSLAISNISNDSVHRAFTSLILSGNIMVNTLGSAVLAMGVFYSRKCGEDQYDNIEGYNQEESFAELNPIIALSDSVLDTSKIREELNVDWITYLEILVTKMNARGRGLAYAIVAAIENYADGVIAAVATSKATERILMRREWRLWKTINSLEFSYDGKHLFQNLGNISAFIKDFRNIR